jgi:hypothetical protein
MAQPTWVADTTDYLDMEAWASSFYERLLETGRVFRRADGTLTYIDPASGPRRILSNDEFRSMAANCLDLRRRPTRRADPAPAFLFRDEAVVLMGSDMRLYLAELEYVLHEPGVISFGGDPILLDEPGYNPTAKSFLWHPPHKAKIELREGTEHLERCFSGVPFLSGAYKNNVFAWLVSGMCLDDINPPMLTVTGNDRGVGKSSLVQACGYILTGEMQNAIKPTGAEFEKQLGAKFAAEQRFIMLDNISTGGQSFKQAKLSSLLTEGRSKQVRRLGHSRNISQTGVLFALTANDCKLDQDLATRSLAIVLHRETPGPMRPYCLSYAREHRKEIYGELLGLAMRREQIPIPDEYETCRFVDWINYVVPIITPKFGSLAIREAEDLDDRIQDLFAWGVDRLNKAFQMKDLFNDVMSQPDRFKGLWESLANAKGDRSKKMKLAKFLSNVCGKIQFINAELTIKLELFNSDGKVNQYVFREI